MHRAGLTQAGNIIGTLDYLAPEQARGGEVDARTDIYALGLICSRCFRASAPFAAIPRRDPRGARRRAAASSQGRRGQGAEVAATRHRTLPRRRSGEALPGRGGARRRSRRRRMRARRLLPRGSVPAAVAAAAVLGVAALGWSWHANRDATAPRDTTPKVAVLPLAAQSGSPDSGWMSTGIPEMIAQGLAENADLQVADSLRVLRTFDDLHLAPERLGEMELARLAELLDVDRLVTGTVREAGGVVRVDLKLFDRHLPDAPAMRDPSGGSRLGALQAVGPARRRPPNRARRGPGATRGILAFRERRGDGGLREGTRPAAAWRHGRRRDGIRAGRGRRSALHVGLGEARGRLPHAGLRRQGARSRAAGRIAPFRALRAHPLRGARTRGGARR